MTDARSDLAHLYRRAGFGARPDELDAAVARGYRATVESLLAGLAGPDPAGDGVALPTLTMPAAYPPPPASADANARLALARQHRAEENQKEQALQAWWVNRMIATSTPLREKLTLLWSGHFATGFAKVANAALMHRQNQLFRTLGAGSFQALTVAVAKDPAMQVWLDAATDVAAQPNENFARELMELFTLGIGNYSEADVKDAARCFTGWSFNRMTGSFVLRSRLHDAGQKTVLGQTGNFDGEDLIRILTNEPASHRFVVAKLWSHLAYPVTQADPVVSELTPAYGQNLDITALLRAIFLHPEFTGATARAGLVKQPVEYVVGAARAFGLGAMPSTAGVAGAAAATRPRRASPSLPQVLRQLAQDLFNPPNVGGWPQNEYWLSTVSAVLRLQFGTQVGASAALDWLSPVPVADRPAALARFLSIDGWGSTTLAALGHVASDPPTLVALALSAPEYVLN
jgi:uncharacterized protein (DUF1800 family)